LILPPKSSDKVYELLYYLPLQLAIEAILHNVKDTSGIMVHVQYPDFSIPLSYTLTTTISLHFPAPTQEKYLVEVSIVKASCLQERQPDNALHYCYDRDVIMQKGSWHSKKTYCCADVDYVELSVPHSIAVFPKTSR